MAAKLIKVKDGFAQEDFHGALRLLACEVSGFVPAVSGARRNFLCFVDPFEDFQKLVGISPMTYFFERETSAVQNMLAMGVEQWNQGVFDGAFFCFEHIWQKEFPKNDREKYLAGFFLGLARLQKGKKSTLDEAERILTEIANTPIRGSFNAEQDMPAKFYMRETVNYLLGCMAFFAISAAPRNYLDAMNFFDQVCVLHQSCVRVMDRRAAFLHRAAWILNGHDEPFTEEGDLCSTLVVDSPHDSVGHVLTDDKWHMLMLGMLYYHLACQDDLLSSSPEGQLVIVSLLALYKKGAYADTSYQEDVKTILQKLVPLVVF